MTRHSKNSNTSAVFTSAERDRLEYGVQERRAGKDSFRNFDACHICLHRAKAPVICEQGHLYCLDCIVESMVAQMEANKQKKAAYEAWMVECRKKEDRAAQAEDDKRVAEFLRQQSGPSTASEPPVKKPKTLASYWVPEMAPSKDAASPVEPPSNKILCKADGEKPHTVSLKRLLAVEWTDDAAKQPICPTCLKAHKNGTQLVALIPCGHVYCEPCMKEFSDKDCSQCGKAVEKRIFLRKEGTGFAAGGGNVLVKKYDVAFQ